jgi:hypothetical protein
MTWITDTEFETKKIARVEGSEQEGWSVTMDDGWSLGVPSFGGRPKKGDAITLWGRGIGYTVRGIAINGVIVRYETEGAERQRFDAEQRESERQRKWAYEQAKPEDDRRIGALPPSLSAILREKLAKSPEFAWDHCGFAYNLYAFEQGVEIAKHLPDEAAIREFPHLPWKQQRKRVPTLDDGHSGGIFGTAIHAALVLLTPNPETKESEKS